MKRAFNLTVVLVLFTAPAWAQIRDRDFPRGRVPYLGGTWYLNGNGNAPCEIIQDRPDGEADFINENGSRTWGTIRGDRVWIPEWNDGGKRAWAGSFGVTGSSGPMGHTGPVTNDPWRNEIVPRC